MIQHTTPLTERQSTTLSNGGKIVVLSPDDLLTLKLLRCDYQSVFIFRNNENGITGKRNLEAEMILETLNRILNQ